MGAATAVVLDARTAHRLSVKTDKASELRGATLGFARSWDDTWLHAGTAAGGRSLRGYYASVDGRASDGTGQGGGPRPSIPPEPAASGSLSGPN
ncbi:hypothetical protein ABZZ47_08110 [Streptomyces sp. NPDC006465]|uniref:hypothetical protein n=1 Tax=Streptomyces sp. NPDC006465 TaxID=3157174 RepID=UPI0033AF6E0F